MTDNKELTNIEKVAAGTSVAVLVSAVVYWLFQAAGVVELLRMAYG